MSLPTRWMSAGHVDANLVAPDDGGSSPRPDGGGVVEQRVEPDVDDLRGVPRHRDSPVEARPGDGQVLQAAADEGGDLVVRALRRDRVRVLLVVRQQGVAEGREPEEPVGLGDDLHRAAVHRAEHLALELAGPGHQVAGELELLAADAVRPLVVPGVDVPGVLEPGQEVLDARLVATLGGADEVVVGHVEGRQHGLPVLGDQPVGPLLGGDTGRLGRAQDLLPVLVGAGEQPDALPALAVPAADRVRRHGRVGMPDVRGVVDVVDGRGDVERLAGRAHGARF